VSSDRSAQGACVQEGRTWLAWPATLANVAAAYIATEDTVDAVSQNLLREGHRRRMFRSCSRAARSASSSKINSVPQILQDRTDYQGGGKT
jgi:hypothetical protein